MPKSIKVSILFFALCLLVNTPVAASIDQCSVLVTPTNISPNSSGNLNFSVTNGESSLVVWIKITSPNGFKLISGESSGFSTNVDNNSIVFTGTDGGFIGASNTVDFMVNVETLSGSQGAFSVQTSDSNDGVNSTTCSGQSTVAMSDSPADTVAPNINSDISISNISESGATISFTSDEPSTAVIYYGLNTVYGLSATGGLTNSHSISISGLSSNTKYHYKIAITDSAGNIVETGDNEFVTAKSGSLTTITTTVTKTTTSIREVKDQTLPMVKLTSVLQKSYTESVELNGIATDQGGIAKVEFSIDNGINWNNIYLQSIGKNSVRFNFTPSIFDDGDYKLRLRVFDSAGNSSLSKTYLFTIDRLPPSIGGIFYSLGPYILKQNGAGDVSILSGLDQKVTLSTVGGVNKVILTLNDQDFNFKKDIESNLWSGKINLSGVGKYKIKVTAYDSAGNMTVRDLGSVDVLDSGNAPRNSQITVYVFDKEVGGFRVWDGSFYGIKNPQTVDSRGDFQYILPKGKYYLKVKNKNFRTFESDIFEISDITVINPNIVLEKLIFGIFNLPNYGKLLFHHQNTLLEVGDDHLSDEIPDISLKSIDNEITNFSLRGKPTVLTIIDTRFPNTPDQLSVLDSFSDDKRFNIVPISIQEPKSVVDVYSTKGGYKIPIFSDSDGLLVQPLNVQTLPASYFYDKRGNLIGFKRGIINRDDILKNLIN